MSTTWPKGAWDAKRKGDKYCAPACGHGCTWQMYQDALDRARKAAATLGPEWIPGAHENMGWHARITCGVVSISVPGSWGSSSYMASTDGRGVLADGKTAKAALRKLRARLVEERDAAQALLDSVM